MSGERRVWKFELGPGRSVLALPEGAEILTVAAQGDDVFLWALCDPDPNAPKVARQFLSVGTGHGWDAHDLGPYIGTAFIDAHESHSALVFHVFAANTGEERVDAG